VREEHSALLRCSAAGVRKAARLRALTIIVRSDSPRAIGLLRAAMAEEDMSIVASAVRLTSELPTRTADILLLDVLVEGRHPRSRTATELEPRSARIRSELLALAAHPDAGLRFWAVTLLGREPKDAAVASALALRASDLDPSVRAAAAEALGKVEPEVSEPILRRLLEDSVFYVRAHAARGAGAAKIDQLAGDLVPLLADTNWWVRAAAKESLLALGAEGFRAAVVALEHEDRFARDGALEIVVGSDHLHDLLAAAGLGDPEAKALAARIAERRARMAEADRIAETPAVPPARVAA
jgi:HEAT repeat protein